MGPKLDGDAVSLGVSSSEALPIGKLECDAKDSGTPPSPPPQGLMASKLLESTTEAKDDSYGSWLRGNLEDGLYQQLPRKEHTQPRQRRKGPPVTALTAAQDDLGYLLPHAPWQDPDLESVT